MAEGAVVGSSSFFFSEAIVEGKEGMRSVVFGLSMSKLNCLFNKNKGWKVQGLRNLTRQQAGHVHLLATDALDFYWNS